MKKEICDAYETIKPDEEARERMLKNIKELASKDCVRRKEVIMRERSKHIMRIAAAAAIAVMIPTVAYATGLFGLHEVNLGKKELEVPVRIEEGDIGTEDKFEMAKFEVDMISLQGMADSPEAKACDEWLDFSDNYDKDGSIIAEIGNEPTEFDKEYPAYLCYTQEMADKIEEICEKYKLKKMDEAIIADDYNSLISQAGIGDVLKSPENTVNNYEGGYYYPNGAFHIEGEAILQGDSECIMDYQFGRSVKGYFDTACLNIGNIDDYDQWEYTTENGETLLLANSNNKALIIVDKEESFIVINVLGDLVKGNEILDSFDVSNEDLERFAEMFDFSAIP